MYKRGRAVSRSERPSQSQVMRSVSRGSRSSSLGAVLGDIGGVRGRQFYSRKQKGTLVKRVSLLERKLEKKYVLARGQTSASTAAAPQLPQCLNAMLRGTTVQTRDGDKLNLLTGMVQGVLYNATTAVSGVSVYRLLVILDRESQNQQLTVTNVFGAAAPGPYTLFNINNLPFFHRFKVLADSGMIRPPVPTVNVPGNNSTAGGNNNQANTYAQDGMPITLKWDCSTYEANYSGGNAGTFADIEKGAIWLMLITDSATAVSYNYDVVQYFEE